MSARAHLYGSALAVEASLARIVCRGFQLHLLLVYPDFYMGIVLNPTNEKRKLLLETPRRPPIRLVFGGPGPVPCVLVARDRTNRDMGYVREEITHPVYASQPLLLAFITDPSDTSGMPQYDLHLPENACVASVPMDARQALFNFIDGIHFLPVVPIEFVDTHHIAITDFGASTGTTHSEVIWPSLTHVEIVDMSFCAAVGNCAVAQMCPERPRLIALMAAVENGLDVLDVGRQREAEALYDELTSADADLLANHGAFFVVAKPQSEDRGDNRNSTLATLGCVFGGSASALIASLEPTPQQQAAAGGVLAALLHTERQHATEQWVHDLLDLLEERLRQRREAGLWQ